MEAFLTQLLRTGSVLVIGIMFGFVLGRAERKDQYRPVGLVGPALVFFAILTILVIAQLP